MTRVIAIGILNNFVLLVSSLSNYQRKPIFQYFLIFFVHVWVVFTDLLGDFTAPVRSAASKAEIRQEDEVTKTSFFLLDLGTYYVQFYSFL